MAPDSFYYFFSIALVLIVILHIAHMIYFRSKHRTFLGEAFKPGTPEYKKVSKLSSTSGLTVAVSLALLFIANLTNSFIRILEIDTSDAHVLLVSAPIVTILFFCGAIWTTRHIFHNGNSKRS